MRTFFYTVWLLIPSLFFLLALWSKLEELSGKTKKDNIADLVRQGFFVLVCAFLAMLIDQYLLESLYASLSPDFIPLGFYQFLLLPAIFYAAAAIFGPSKDIRITKAPKPTSRKRK